MGDVQILTWADIVGGMGRGLSEQERSVLVHLYRAYAGQDWGYWGMPVGRLPGGVSRSYSASLSRTVRRLEDRGLIQRRNWASGDRHQVWRDRETGEEYQGWFDPFRGKQHRTTNVKFTDAGLELAARLSVNSET